MSVVPSELSLQFVLNKHTHPHTPRAHYWLMVDAHKNKNSPVAKEHANKIIENLKTIIDLKSLIYEVCALYVLHDENVEKLRQHTSEDCELAR